MRLDMRPLLFLASIAAVSILPSRTVPPERGPAPRPGPAWYAGEPGVAIAQVQPTAGPTATAPGRDSVVRRGSAAPAASPGSATKSAPLASPKASPSFTQWFHPAGHRCPAWQYGGAAAAPAESARVGCQRYSLRWFNAAPCVPKRGPSIPSC
jgi:hypothetical protein